MKIDIEGGEFEILPDMKDYLIEEKPIVYLSTHCPFLNADDRKRKMQNVIEVLSAYKYCLNENFESVSINKMLLQCNEEVFSSYVFMD